VLIHGRALKRTGEASDPFVVQSMRGTVTEWRRGLSAVWLTDFSNPAEMAALRARAIGMSAMLGIVADLSALLAVPDVSERAWMGQGLTLAYLLLIAVWSRRGERIGDREYLFIVVTTYVYATAAVVLGAGSGQVAITALSIVAIGIMGALFCGPRRHVAFQAMFGMGMLLLAQRGSPRTPVTAMATTTGAFDIIVVCLVVRVLKDLAVASLARSKQGEATDPLTGLANRRGLEQSGPPRWVARARLGLPIAILVIDVDHFKRINDTEGHAAGDQVLRRLAMVITEAIRLDDLAVRLGGEEFLVLASLPQGHGEQAAERLRTTIERELAPVTVSIGVHELMPDSRPEMPAALWAAIDSADRALYVAKNTGRNRVVSTAGQHMSPQTAHRRWTPSGS
jgi:diguanylate cyclase (GGDEF)-like protein